MTLAAAVAAYTTATHDLDTARTDQDATHAAHKATIAVVDANGVRWGNGSPDTGRAHVKACAAAFEAQQAWEAARDRVVAAALQHDCGTG